LVVVLHNWLRRAAASSSTNTNTRHSVLCLHNKLFSSLILPTDSLVNKTHAPPSFDPSTAVVYDSFLSQEEANLLEQEVAVRMKKRRYERGHWDAVILGYKEVELGEGTVGNEVLAIMKRTRSFLEQQHHLVCNNTVEWLPCHAIDLKADGKLLAHVDSVRFSGDVVAGISLLSTCIMRLQRQQQQQQEEGFVDLLLPPRSLYVLKGTSRYEFTHEILNNGAVFVDTGGTGENNNNTTMTVSREQRYSIIFRDAKAPEEE